MLKQTAQRSIAPRISFTDKWAGKFSVRESDGRDDLLVALKRRYDLAD